MWTIPNSISLMRVPLAAAFPLTIHHPRIAVLVLVASALTDIVDGWWARTHECVTPLGAVLDPVTDKIFVLAVVVTLVVNGNLGWLGVLCLATREIGEAPLVIWIAASARMRERHAKTAGANIPGKLATALQFACVTLAIVGWSSSLRVLLVIAAVVGVLAATTYWLRAIRER